MDKDTALLLDDLRKKSRTLLALTTKNSEKIDKEIKRLCLQDSTFERRYEYKERQNPYLKSHSEIWKLRNDSSAINNLLCQDYHFETKNRTSVSASNMRPLERIVIPSRNLSHAHCTCVVSREPVKECYCNIEMKRTRSSRTRQKSTVSGNYGKNHICHIPLSINEANLQDISPPISCETIRRVQKLNYSPKSQFLRNVQKKIQVLKNVPFGDCPDTCPRSPYYHKLKTDKATEVDTQSRIINHSSSKPSPTNSERSVQEFVANEEERQPRREVITKSNKSVQVSSRKPSKTKLLVKKTISSKKSIPERRKEKSEKFTKSSERKESSTYRVSSEDRKESYRKRSSWVLMREKDDQEKTETSSNSETKELSKFREQNYFDTHGSSQTLVSSKSSGSLQQCLLNDRLFAEPVKRIHRKDLVVTMPPCTTIQKQRVHYFPRYVVRQEKSNCNTNYKKKRHACPLTGHAIDLGIIRSRPVLNSLALKYQKRLP
ncbi:hypothetical protein KPH14_004849 [Odynerus spinipes]|uniref:Uncharacterized protein n=1 Tax=Odynerus spinipes TaxID=1348599 RepID=A0AAD9VPU1_9HYME|nr:hypothetical protein KPH14_004849 [Odynerus spinipes]